MRTQIVEVTNGPQNWGKFLVGQFDAEWHRTVMVTDETSIARMRLLDRVGWTSEHFLLLDLQTGEGAIFKKGGYAKSDLSKHRVWVCPLFEPFLQWLYQQPTLDVLPDLLDLPDAPFAWQGYRREGPPPQVAP